jgi:hypothetical protein
VELGSNCKEQGCGSYSVRFLILTPLPCQESKFLLLLKALHPWTSLTVQWLRLCASNAGGMGPSRGTKILCAVWCDQKNTPSLACDN